MSEERKKVLEMLAEGKITTEEAERLFEKLEASAESDGETSGLRSTGVPKYLRVVVDGNKGDKVNIRVPLALVRTGIKLSTMLPSAANQQMKEKGIDLGQLSELQGDELLKALSELSVDVDSADGDVVRVFCE